MKSIYFRNFLSTALMVLMSFLIIGAALFFLGQNFIINSHRDSMKSNAEAVARVAETVEDNNALYDWGIRINLSVAAENSGNDIFLADTQGRIVTCSDDPGTCTHVGKYVNESFINAIRFKGEIDLVTDLDGVFPTQRYVYAIPLSDDSDVGYIFVSSTRSTIIGAWGAFLWVFLAVALAILSLALVMSLVISKKLSEPLDEMTSAARRYAHGDFSVRVREDKGTDELAALTSSFNAMADSLERSEELRNEFIANVSHELKTPMTTIAGFADGILDGTIPKEEEDKYLATIADETRRLSRLVRHMLSLSRMRSEGLDMTKRRDFDLNELIIRTLLNFETRAEDKNLDMDLQLPEDHMTVTADPDSITQVIYNLLDNAIKFADKGSTVTVALWKQNGKAYVSVKDRGDTIPPDDLPLIFDRFHKSDRSRSKDRDGVGLGLYLVKSILDAHNEDIAVTSADGVTEFVFTLTLSREKPKSEKAKAEKTAAKAEKAKSGTAKRRAAPEKTGKAENQFDMEDKAR